MKPAKVKIKDQPQNSSFNEKRKSKQGYEPGHMLLLPSVPTESVAQYSLALPSTNKDRSLDEMDVLKNITVHLNEKEEHEDMTTFLICCSQVSNQLDCALREEKQILESLLQWFEKEVHEMEEIGEEELIPDWQVPVADKNISNNINKLMNRIQKLEDLKGRIQELPKLIQLSAPKHEKKKPLGPVAPAPKDPKHILEELAMKHATEDVMNMVQVFQDDTGQQTMDSMNNRILEIMKVFERQTNKLHRVSNEQDVLEGKLQKIQQEFRKLAEEKEIMEDELQKMKGSEQEKGAQDTRKKMLSKLEKEKEKVEEKPPHVIVEKPTPIPLKHKDAENQKVKEELAKAQASIQTLEQEKKMLEEKLQKALEEAEMAKIHLAEVPPTIPDWQFPHIEIEDEKDVQKKGKKGTKPKGTDVQKMAVSGPDTGKAGETFPAKDVKQEGQEKESEKRMEESRKTKAGKSEGADSKTVKAKDSAEIRKRRQATKGAEKKTYDSPVSKLPPSPPIEEKRLPALTKVVEETVSETLDKSPEEVLPPDSKKRKTTSPELNVPEETTSLPTSEQEASSLLSEIKMEDAAQPKTIMRDTERIPAAISPEQASTLQKEIPQTDIDSSGIEEAGTKNLINKKMDQLANNLAELKGVPEAETLAKLLLEPGKGMELLSDEQRLQLLNQLIPPDGLQPLGKPEEEQTEQKRQLLSKVVSTLQLLQQAHVSEDGLSEEEMNEMADKKRALLANLDSNLKLLQPAEAVRPRQQDIDNEINKLSEKGSHLRATLESNMRDLEEAQALAATEPSEMNENKVKELLQQRELLTADLEQNMQDLQTTKALAAVLEEKAKPEQRLQELSELRQHLAEELKDLKETMQDMEEIELQASQRALFLMPSEKGLNELYELTEKKQLLLEKLASTKKELQEAQELAATQPGSVSEHKLQELAEQKIHLTADLEATLDGIQNVYRRASERTVFVRPTERKVYELSEKKQELLEKLESNRKQLEAAHALAIAQPGSISDHKLQELVEQRRCLTAELDSTVHEMQEAQDSVSEGFAFIAGKELYELSAKKQELQQKLESNQKELLEAQALAVAEPGSISETKLQELAEQKELLSKELEETVRDIEEAKDRVSERALAGKPPEMELYGLSVKKEMLQEMLEANQKELEEALALAAAEPGSVSEHKLQELAEQRKKLTAELKATVYNIKKAQRRASQRSALEPPAERELFELAVKKQLLQADLESNWKELQEAQALAVTEPGSISEHKLQQLTEETRLLTLDLMETMNNMQNVERRASERALIETPTGRKFYDLLEKKQQLEANLESNWEKLQEVEALAATQPGIISERKLEELAEERKRLTKELDATAEDILEAHRQASEKALFRKPAEKDLYALSEKKQMLLENLKGLQEAQALAATQSGIVGEEKRKQLAEQKQRLAADLEATMHDIQKAQRHVSAVPTTMSPSENELYELSEKKSLILENLAFNRKQLQEAQALAALHPGTVSDHKLEELAQERKRLTEDLREAVQSLHEIQRRSSQKGQIDSVEEELEELAMKKKQLLQKLESNQKLLEEAEVLEATQPGTITKNKLKEVAEERKRLTEELEEILHKMLLKEVQHHVSKPTEKELYKLSEWKQHLLDNLESNMKELEEALALAATRPDNLLEKLNEERRTLIKNLEKVVEDSQKMKSRLFETGGVIKPIERDLSHLLQKKKLFLERLDSNLKNWLEAQKLAATQPSSTNEKKFKHLTEERRLLAAGLEAVIQDIQNIQDADPEKQIKAREMALKQLYEKKRVFLENLKTNFKELREAQALAAAEPGGISELKVQELIHQRRLLTVGLDAIMQSMEEIENLIAGNVEIAKPSEIELDKIYEKRTLLLENMELNLQELKDLAKDEVSEKKIQVIREKRNRLVSSFEAILQNMEEALSLDQKARTRPDERNISDLIELSNLESKLDEMQNLGVFSSFQLDNIRKKMYKLKEQKKKLISKWEKQFLKEYPEGYIPEPTRKVKTPKELAGKGLFSYLQSSIKDLQGIIRQGSVSDEELDKLAEEKKIVDRYFEEVPIEFLPSDVASLSTQHEDEKTLKRRALAAKLEANIRDLQSALQVDKLEKPRFERECRVKANYIADTSFAQKIVNYTVFCPWLFSSWNSPEPFWPLPVLTPPRCAPLPLLPKSVLRTTGKRKISLPEPSDQQELRPQLSGLQIHISKVPGKYKTCYLKYRVCFQGCPLYCALFDMVAEDLNGLGYDPCHVTVAGEQRTLGTLIFSQLSVFIFNNTLFLQSYLGLSTPRFEYFQFKYSADLSGTDSPIAQWEHIVANRIKPSSKTVYAGYDTKVQEEQDQLLKKDIELGIKGRLLEEFPESKVSLPQLDSSTYLHANSHRLALEAAMQEILEYNQNLLPGHRTNLQQALHLASYQLQQKQLQQQRQANALAEKFRNIPLFFSPPPGTARFQDYTIPGQKSGNKLSPKNVKYCYINCFHKSDYNYYQLQRHVTMYSKQHCVLSKTQYYIRFLYISYAGWETKQLPQKDYFQKLALLRRKILGPEMKGGGPSVTQDQDQDQEEDPIAISGKGCNPYKKVTTFPVIRQSSKHK
ncbi:A-kinase anchor protein 9 [Zootoca vivipara]|uniref:A-kinase anchor protein 9 n=1 Tax=Zootoca vivipara TaxID=8524 RepID=UPI00293BBE19|nr:A-kinase anchor protein 9 [Zootoca vivipara]